MKTTIEIPDLLFRKAKSHAAARGQTLKEFVTDALQAKLATPSERDDGSEPRWMAGFGKLRHLRNESARIRKRIDEAFELVEPEDRS